MKVDGATSKDIIDYFFDVEAKKNFLEKGKNYLHKLFEKLDLHESFEK